MTFCFLKIGHCDLLFPKDCTLWPFVTDRLYTVTWQLETFSSMKRELSRSATLASLRYKDVKFNKLPVRIYCTSVKMLVALMTNFVAPIAYSFYLSCRNACGSI